VIPLDEILESLDLSRARPGVGFLAALFARFNARVPFESASKIVRNAEVAGQAGKPRRPEVFWADHLRQGTGGTCFARTAAFATLLAGLGFRARHILGCVRRRGDHAALMVETPEGESIVDVGFPLPAILPARAGAVATPIGELAVSEEPSGFRVVFRDGVPEGPRSVEVLSAPVDDQLFERMWRRTFHRGTRFLRGVRLRRDLENRVVSFSEGEIRVDDLHSRLRLPLGGAHVETLANLFGIDAEVLSRALALCPSRSAAGGARLTSYFPVETGARAAFEAIAAPGAYRRLVAGMGEIVREEETGRGFRFVFGPPSAPKQFQIEEEVVADPEARRIDVLRRQGGVESPSAYFVIEREDRTYLVREAALSGECEDLLRNDSLRGRLAGGLALDLLAWARLL
jgi:hypothetical protein